MTAVFDIAIIGGGVIGMSIARELAAAKMRVAVIDARDIPAATNAAAGMLAPSFEADTQNSALYDLSAQSLAMWRGFAPALEEETGQFIDYRADGILGLALDEATAMSLAAASEAMRSRGALSRRCSPVRRRGRSSRPCRLTWSRRSSQRKTGRWTRACCSAR